MFSVKIKLLFFGCFDLITNQCAVVESSILPIDLSLTDNERNISLTNTVPSLGNIVGGVVSDTTSILQDSVTKALCNLRTVNICVVSKVEESNKFNGILF